MRCRKARHLIDISVDAPLSGRLETLLAAHLEHCDACQAYTDRLCSLSRLLQEDAEAHSGRSLRAAFEDRLHTVLLAESRARSETPAERLSNLLLGPGRVPALRRAINAAAVAAAAVSLAALMSSPPSPAPTQCRFGHIASLSVKRLPDGRVVAALTDRSAPSRDCLRQERRP